MADIGKVMFLDLRKAQIEERLKEARVIVQAFKVVENHWDEFDESLKEAEAELLEASEEYKREKGVEA